jgi:hypothetical protein
MSDSYVGFMVVLEHDLKDEDAEPVIDAIRHIRGVQQVEPVKRDLTAKMIEVSRLRMDIAEQLYQFALKIRAGRDDD